MSAVVKLSSKMPGDPEVNGVDAKRSWLESNPDELLVCVVYLDTAKITIDTDSGEHVPTVRVRRIEPIGTLADVPQSVKDAVAVAEEERTGRTPIPFDIVDVGEGAYSDPLPDSDER